MKDNFVSLNEILESLKRSGYLLEARLVSALTERHYFVEPNQVVLDKRTGKSREIDLVAEYFSYTPERPHVCVRTHFVIEAINNKFPFVLTTQRPNSPGANTEDYVKCICTPDPNPFFNGIDVYEKKSPSWDNLYSQYCALSKKNNGELMASHPDDVYSSLVKLSEFIENAMSEWQQEDSPKNDGYWRLFFWHPMLVLSGQLVSVDLSSDGSPTLKEVSFGQLEFNWHSDGQPKTTIIDVVTEDFFLKRLETIVKEDNEIEGEIYSMRQKLFLPGR